MTEKVFNGKVMGSIQFSLSISKIVHEKARTPELNVFAAFELAEATVVVSVLKELESLATEMDEDSKVTFSGIESQAAGIGLDKRYIEAQLKNHRYLRDLTEEYLKEAPTGHLDKVESEEKHLARLMLLMFNEHIAIAEKINDEIAAEVKE